MREEISTKQEDCFRTSDFLDVKVLSEVYRCVSLLKRICEVGKRYQTMSRAVVDLQLQNLKMESKVRLCKLPAFEVGEDVKLRRVKDSAML
jgi:hypothetical protein